MNDFKVEYLENMKFVDWDNYEKSEMKDDCIKYIKDLQQRIDKAIEYIEQHTNDTVECLYVFEVKELLSILKGE